MAINAARPRAMTDGSQTGIVDTSVTVTEGDLLKYDSTKKMYVPANATSFALSSFANDLNIISLADVNSAIDAHAVASGGGGEVDLSTYATDAEVSALFTAYVPVVDYANVTNTPSLASYASSLYVDQQIAALNLFSGSYTDLINAPTIFSGSYADLTGQPNIPSITGLATVSYVDTQISEITHPENDLSNYALTTALSVYSTITYVDQQIANVSGGGLSDYVTSTALATTLTGYALTGTLFSGDYADLINIPANLVTTTYLTSQLANYQSSVDLSNYALITSLFSGSYTDLTNKPTLFSGSYNDLINQPNIFSGSYADLTEQPTIPSITGLSTVAYVDQQIANVAGGGGIDLSSYTTDTELATAIAAIVIPADVSDLTDTTSLLGSGGGTTNYNNLTNKPTIPSIVGLSTETFVTTAIAAAGIAAISALNDLNDVAIDGTETVTHALMYNSLSSMWENVDLSVNYASKDYVTAQLVGLQTDGTIDLEGYASESWVTQKLVERGNHFSGNYNDLTNNPTLFSGDYNDLANIPVGGAVLSFTLSGNTLALSNGNDVDLSTLALDYTNLTNAPTQFSGNYADLTNLPTLFSGNYIDLANKPYIPSIAGLATESYVNNKWAEPDITGDRNFTHNVEFRADIKQIATSATTTASKRDVVFAIETTDAVSTEVAFSDSTYITLSDNTTAKFTATYVATSGTVHDSFTVSGIVHKMSGTLVAIGNNNYEVTQDSNSGFTGAVSVDSVNDRMTVTVQGAAATTVDWVVFVELTEVTR